ncbi:MAG: Ig-like domain-containing protein, partial [Vampirovibrionia bacterium]
TTTTAVNNNGSSSANATNATVDANNTSKTVDDDKTAPTLSSSKPSNGDANIAINSSIDLTFGENIKLADAGKVKLFEKNGGALVGIDVSVEQDNTLKIKPKEALKPNTKYYVKIEAGAVKDNSGNDYAGINNDNELSFTTAPADDSKKEVVKPESKNPTLAKVLNNVIEGTVRIGTDVTASGTNTDRGASGTPDRTETGATQTRLNLEESSTSTTKSTNPNLTNLIKLRNALDILESDDVHITLTNYNYTENTEIGAINSALKQVSNLESVDKRDFRRHVFNQAVKDYKKINETDANKASDYLRNEPNKMTKENAEALTRVLTKYKEKYTALKDSVSEESLKNYFTDNYNDLNPLFGGRNGELPDPQSIKGLSKDALINLAITARNSLNSRIDIKGKEASPEEYRALLSKYLGIKKDVPSMRKFIEGLNEEEFALYSSFRNDFCSKRYILGELSQHELMSVAEVGSSRASSYITPDTYNKFFEKYKPEEKDLNKQKEFINSLSIDELVLCGLSSKEELLKRVAGNTKNEQPLKDLLNVKSLAADNLRIYLTNIQDPKSRIEKIDALPEKTKKILKEEGQLS